MDRFDIPFPHLSNYLQLLKTLTTSLDIPDPLHDGAVSGIFHLFQQRIDIHLFHLGIFLKPLVQTSVFQHSIVMHNANPIHRKKSRMTLKTSPFLTILVQVPASRSRFFISFYIVHPRQCVIIQIRYVCYDCFLHGWNPRHRTVLHLCSLFLIYLTISCVHLP